MSKDSAVVHCSVPFKARHKKFVSVSGENWVLGKHLLPELERLGQRQTGVLLDLACGESPFRDCFSRVQTYIRIDSYPIDSDVIVGDMRNIPLTSGSVDVVLLCQAITDVPNPIDVLREVARVLRPGGEVIVFESMAYPEHDAPNDFYRLMPEGLRVLASDAGMRVSEFIHLGGLFARFASLWNTFVMGKMKQYIVLLPFAHLGVVLANIICLGLDRMFPHPRLAPDYLAVLTFDSAVRVRHQAMS